MSNAKRYFRYRVVEVGGSMVGRVSVGDLTFDWWHGRGHTYRVYNLAAGEETGWYRVKSEGECSVEEYERLAAIGRHVVTAASASRPLDGVPAGRTFLRGRSSSGVSSRPRITRFAQSPNPRKGSE